MKNLMIGSTLAHSANIDKHAHQKKIAAIIVSAVDVDVDVDVDEATVEHLVAKGAEGGFTGRSQDNRGCVAEQPEEY